MLITNVIFAITIVRYLIKNLINFTIVMNSVINFYIDSADTDLDGEN